MTVGPKTVRKSLADVPVGGVHQSIALWDAIVRNIAILSIVVLFAVVNLITLGLVYLLFEADQAGLAAKTILPADRIVTTKVLVTLLEATTVQLGFIAAIMARSVFRDR